jgi:hypothetical protein
MRSFFSEDRDLCVNIGKKKDSRVAALSGWYPRNEVAINLRWI